MKLVGKKNWNLPFVLSAISIFIIFTILSFGGDAGLVHLFHLKQTTNQLKNENLKLIQEYLALNLEIKNLNNPKTIERLAQENLNYIFEDDVIFVINQDPLE